MVVANQGEGIGGHGFEINMAQAIVISDSHILRNINSQYFREAALGLSQEIELLNRVNQGQLQAVVKGLDILSKEVNENTYLAQRAMIEGVDDITNDLLKIIRNRQQELMRAIDINQSKEVALIKDAQHAFIGSIESYLYQFEQLNARYEEAWNRGQTSRHGRYGMARMFKPTSLDKHGAEEPKQVSNHEDNAEYPVRKVGR